MSRIRSARAERTRRLPPAVCAAVCAAVVGMLVAACGGAASPATDLRITLWPAGKAGPVERWTLACRPPRGTLPAADQACPRLEGVEEPFASVPADARCTQIYGGPEEARVVGTYRGARVDARFTKRNGCEITRWNRIEFLLAPAGEVERR